MSGKRKTDHALDGMCFAITGSLSVVRAEFENFIKNNGGTVAKSVTNSVTHLVSSETGTKKCQDAEAKGIEIVDEEWVRNAVEGGGSSPAEAPSKKAKKASSQEPTSASATSDGNRLSGKCFAISGTLSVSRADFENFLKANGGTIAKSITKACTHLVTSESDTKKCQEAEDKGVQIVDEDWVRNVVDGNDEDGDGDDDDDGEGEGDNDDDDEEEEERNPGDDIDITGTEIEIGEPPYKRSFLKKICDRGTQYKALRAGGDFEAWLDDLLILLPSMVNLEIVEFLIPQSGCEGLIEVLELLNKSCPLLKECILEDSFEQESMEIIRTLLLDHPALEILNVTHDSSDDDISESNEKVVVGGIRETFEKHRKGCKLREFEGFELGNKKNLEVLGIPEERRGELEGKSNEEVLAVLRGMYQ